MQLTPPKLFFQEGDWGYAPLTMSSFNKGEIYFDAYDDEQFLHDVIATEEEENYFDVSDDDSLLIEALDDQEQIQSGGGGEQFHFQLEEFSQLVNRRLEPYNKTIACEFSTMKMFKVAMLFKNLSGSSPMF